MPTPDPSVVDTSTPQQGRIQDNLLPLIFQFLADPTGEGNFFNQIGGPNAATSGAETALQSILSQGAGPGGLLRAAQPIFQENLRRGFSELSSAAPVTSGSAFGSQAIDFATRQDNAFNLFVEQAMQNFFNQQISAAGQLGQIGQNQTANRVNPTLGFLQSILGISGLDSSAVVQGAGPLDYLTQLATAAIPLIPGGGATGK